MSEKEKPNFNIKRVPAEESQDIYPGLCVNDDRVSGSITVGPTRLPIWAFVTEAIISGWEEVIENYPQT